MILAGGWGERFFPVALLKDKFKNIKVNDLSKDLSQGYEKLKNQIQDKNITFTYMDALNHDSGTNDFIFTGSPFFHLEKYLHAQFTNFAEKRKAKNSTNETITYNADHWIQTWTAPLIMKLLNSLTPGGILAFNLGNVPEMGSQLQINLVEKLHNELRKNPDFETKTTLSSRNLWGKIFYSSKNTNSNKQSPSKIIILQKAHELKQELSN